MSKKYCIFSAQYLPHMGGVERYTYNIARQLSTLGNDVTIITCNTTHGNFHEKIENVTIYRLPCYPAISGRFPIPKFNLNYFKMIKKLKNLDFDYIIVNTRFYFHSLYGVRFAHKKNIPCICIEHGTSHLTMHNSVLDKIGNIYEHFITLIIKFYCHNFYGVSKACCDWLKHFHIHAKGVLYNAIDINEIRELQHNTVRNFRKEFSIFPNELIVTFTGRLLKEKGILELIKAIEIYNTSHSPVHLFIAGDGPEKEYVNSHSSSYIHPLGAISYHEIINLLDQSNIFCLPSFSEGFSTAALEAAACKCYIITTRRGGTKELIKTADYGIVMDNNAISNIALALENALSNPIRRLNSCNLCYNYLRTNFTWENTVNELIKAFTNNKKH